MIRYTLFVLTTLATAASTVSAIAPVHEDIDLTAKNITVIEKNQAFPLYGPIVVEGCATEYCSEVRS
jgi:hypothetical protein